LGSSTNPEFNLTKSNFGPHQQGPKVSSASVRADDVWNFLALFSFGIMKLESPMSLANVDDLEPFAYSVKDLVRRLPLCRGTIEGLIRRGELEVAQVGSRRLILHKSVENFLARRTIKPEVAE
jgi:excisionase family DNA binding protein